MGKRILTISGELFPQIFAGEKHYRVIKDAIPADAKITNVQLLFRWDNRPQDIAFLVESEEWDDPPEGERIPQINPTMESLYPKEGSYLTFAETYK